ncbi:MAG: CpXC domain-containing protein [Aerococcaceae bacterium]|nr:CpXC domain-containing protein [Aerococcaceae bacterium]
MTQALQLSCPVCQAKKDFNYINHLNISKNPELKDALLKGDLFRFECDECGAVRQLDMQFLYHDPDKKFMVFMLPEYQRDNENVTRILQEVIHAQPFSLSDYRLRIALHGTDLVEKIHIFDTGYDDQEVEIVKLLTDGLFAQEKPTTPVKARFFYWNQTEPKILYITDKEQILVDFHEKLLHFAREKYGKILAKTKLGEFALINHRWAMNILEKKEPEAEV